MKQISLTQGHFAVVDDDDFKTLSVFKWYAAKTTKAGDFYAVRGIRRRGTYQNVRMHRVIMSAKTGEVVDHRNHNTLDNRKDNLRLVTNSQNAMNRKGANINSRTGIRGVYFDNVEKKFRATIRVDGRQKSIGRFRTIKAAAIAWDKAKNDFYGEYGG